MPAESQQGRKFKTSSQVRGSVAGLDTVGTIHVLVPREGWGRGPHSLCQGASLATLRGVWSCLRWHLSGQSAQTWGSLAGTREVQSTHVGQFPFLAAAVPLAKENMIGLPSESVNAHPVLVDCPDLCYKQA